MGRKSNAKKDPYHRVEYLAKQAKRSALGDDILKARREWEAEGRKPLDDRLVYVRTKDRKQ